LQLVLRLLWHRFLKTIAGKIELLLSSSCVTWIGLRVKGGVLDSGNQETEVGRCVMAFADALRDVAHETIARLLGHAS